MKIRIKKTIEIKPEYSNLKFDRDHDVLEVVHETRGRVGPKLIQGYMVQGEGQRVLINASDCVLIDNT